MSRAELRRRIAALQAEESRQISLVGAYEKKREKAKAAEARKAFNAARTERRKLQGQLAKMPTTDEEVNLKIPQGLTDQLKKQGKKVAEKGVELARFMNDVRALIVELEKLNRWIADKDDAAIYKNASEFWNSWKPANAERIARLRSALISQLSLDSSALAKLASQNDVKKVVSLLGRASKTLSAKPTDQHRDLRKAMDDLANRSNQMNVAARLAVGAMFSLRNPPDGSESSLPDLHQQELLVFLGQPDTPAPAAVTSMLATHTTLVGSALDAIAAPLMLILERAVGPAEPRVYKAVNMHSSMADLQEHTLDKLPHSMRVIPMLGASLSADLESVKTAFQQQPTLSLTAEQMDAMKELGAQQAMSDLQLVGMHFMEQLAVRKFSLDLTPLDARCVGQPCGASILAGCV